MNRSVLPEILAPAGNLEKFRTALLYGANAVYIGGEVMNLRSSSVGLPSGQISAAVKEAEAKNASLFYCINSMPMQKDMAALPGIIESAASAGVHAFIISDPGTLSLARRYAPGVPVHLSTQANTTNADAVNFWRDAGADRINLARELSCDDILAIRQSCPDAELEIFIHGAMCLALSGQCLLSAWMNERSANLGQCTQPCRFEYRAMDFTPDKLWTSDTVCAEGYSLTVEEALRSGHPAWQITNEGNYSAFWAPDDLCLLPYLPWFIANKITALKIEGRMKSAAYVAHVTDAYSSALKAAAGVEGISDVPSGDNYDYLPFLREILINSFRPLTSGFFIPGKRVDITANAGLLPEEGPSRKLSGVLARVIEPVENSQDAWIIDVKENWDKNRPVDLMLPGMKRPALEPGAYSLENHRGELSSQVNNGTRAILRIENPTGIEPGIFIRGR